MGSVQSKIRRAFKKKSKKITNNNSRINLTQSPPPKHVLGESSSALGALQQQANATYQDAEVVLHESLVPSEATDVPNNALPGPEFTPPHILATTTSVEISEDVPQLGHGTTVVSEAGLPISPQCEVGKMGRQVSLSSYEAADTTKARISTLWREAIGNLKQKEKFEVQTDSESDMKPVQNLLDDVKKNRTIIENQRIRYKNSEGEYVAVADTIFRELNNFAFVGDVALQHHPDVVALVWSGFRLLLHIGISYANNLAMILSSLGYLAWVICCGALYEDLYLEIDTELSRELRGCLVAQYVSILSYLSYANRHLQRDKTERVFESLSPRLSRLLDSVRESEKTIKDRADIAEREAVQKDRLNQNQSRQNVAAQLKLVRRQLKEVETALNECHTKLIHLCNIFDETIFHNTLHWVSNVQYGKIHEEHNKRRTPHTCLWLENNEKLQSWIHCRSPSPVLWLRGAAGTGKTILASSIIDLLQRKYTKSRCLTYFYCSKTSPDRSMPESVLRAITKQLCHAYSGDQLPRKLVQIRERRIRESAGLLSLEESEDLIQELSNYLSGVWIVIDALDECDPTTRKDLFRSLNRIVTSGKEVRIFLTGRNEVDISTFMETYADYLIDPKDNAGDIELYVKSELENLYQDLRDNNAEPATITQMRVREEENIRLLTGDATGMFLSVHLRMKALLSETTLIGMMEAMKEFPQSLHATYVDILERIRNQGKKDCESAYEILKWLFYAFEDCSPKIVLRALCYTASSGINKPEIRTVANAQLICRGLVIYDANTEVFRFSHATVKEYFVEIEKEPHSCLRGGHEMIADICFKIFSSANYLEETNSIEDAPTDSLAHYVTRNWGNHVRYCESRDTCQNFLNPSSSCYEAWSSKAAETIPALRMKGHTGRCVDLVWVACYYRLLGTLKTNLETIGAGCVNTAGRTPLHHCAEHGYLEFVEYLVKHKDTAVNAEDDMKRTPLLLAVISNQVDVVRALLKHQGLGVDMVDKDRRTALMHASMAGNDGILRLLLNPINYVDVNARDERGYTALHHAILERHESILDLLFGVPSLNINTRDATGNTALSLASRSDKDIRVVEKLLRYTASSGPDIDPNLANNRRETPLFVAAGLGQQTVAERLIEDDRVDINCGTAEDNMFIVAAEKNKDWLVKLLVARQDLDINRRGYGDWTALSNAVRYKALEALKYIIATPGVDIECQDERGDTLLHVAVGGNSTAIVSELLAYGASTSTANRSGQTPLVLTAKEGNFDMFKLLLAHYNLVNPQDRVTQLLGAAESDDVRITQLILNQRGYDINQKNRSCKTELMIAAENGLTGAVQTLLGNDAINVNVVDDEDETALSLAASNGHSLILEALIRDQRTERNIINHRNKSGQTALMMAAAKGFTDCAQVLLKEDAVDINTVDNEDQSALSLAILNGHSSAVEILVENPDIEIKLPAHSSTILPQWIFECPADRLPDPILNKYPWLEMCKELDGKRFISLISAASSNNIPIMQCLLTNGCPVNYTNKLGETALIRAARYGQNEAVMMLLREKVTDINLVDCSGASALLLAAVNGYTEVVQTLLKMDGIDVNLVDSNGRSALFLAAGNGHTEVVQTLLKMDGIDVNLVDPYGASAFRLAAGNGHTGVVQTLLEMDGIDVNLVDSNGRSALFLAAGNGHTEVVQALLKMDGIDVNLVDSNGRSALLFAAENGHTEVVQMLLKMDGIDVNLVDPYGASAFRLAAQNGHTEVVQTLLKMDGIDVNLVDSNGRSALLLAAVNGHIEVVETLLKMDGIDVNPVDSNGKSALIYAAIKRHTEVVQTLLKMDGIDVNLVDSNGASALIFAAGHRHTEVVQALLKMDGIDINLIDSNGASALLLAAVNGHTEVVQALLKMDGIDVNLVNSNGRSALLFAAQNGHTEVVQTLLKMNGIDVNLVDSNGASALLLAAQNGHTEVVQALLKMDGIDVNLVDSNGRSALLFAAENGHTEVVQALLKMDGIDVKLVDSNGRSALLLAAQNGHTEVVQMLLEMDGIDVNLVNSNGRSALLLAARNGHTEVVQMLLKMDGIDVNIIDRRGTPLFYSTKGGHIQIVNALLKHQQINVRHCNSHGTTPLLVAAEKGHNEVFEYLLKRYETEQLQEMDGDGDTLLILSAECGNTRIIQLVLDGGCYKINHRNRTGNTALIRASERGHKDAVEILLKETGIDLGIVNKEERSALDRAKEENHKEVIKLLESRMGQKVK